MVETASEITRNFIVNGVEFEIKKSYLSFETKDYTKHEIVNLINGKTATVSHEKIKQYLSN